MAYDKKSDIGEFKSQQGNPQVGQINIYKQDIREIPLGETKTVTMPLGEIRTANIPLRNSAKQIELLDMEQFGHNIVKLRKSISITDATKVNTDKEYGVMQIEDYFELVDIDNSESIVGNLGTKYTYYCKNIMTSNKTTLLSNINSLTMLGGASDWRIFPTQIINRIDGIVGNIFYLDRFSTGDAISIAGDGVYVIESSSSGGYLDSSFKLINSVDAFGIFPSTVNRFTVTIGKDSVVVTDILKMKIESRKRPWGTLTSTT